jgi:hypothetical protein
MTQRIQVRGELSIWVHAGRVISALSLFIGLGITLAVAPWGWLVAGGSAAAWLALELMAWRARQVRTWLTLHPDGIEVEIRSGLRAIHDSQVTAVAFETKKNLNNGELSSITRKFAIWAEDQPEPVRMANTIKLGKPDPLAGLIQRLQGRLSQRMEGELARGGTASGDGWHLSRTAITLGRPPHDEQIPLSDVTAVEAFDGQMCIWRSSSDVAAVKLPLSGRNVHLLPALVRPFLVQARSANPSSDAFSGLGRVLFERRPHRNTVLAVSIAGVMMAATGAALLATFGGRQNVAEGIFVAALVLLGVGPVLGLVGWWLARTSFRCHERGVWKTTPLGQQTLRYEDVGRFQYSAVRHYHNGAYLGTQLSLRFRPLTSARGAPIKFTTRIRGDDDDLEGLRDSISQQIAARLAEQLRAGQAVEWTPNLQFLPEGIRYRPGGLFGRKPPQLLPYSEYGGHDLKDGAIYLFARGTQKHVVREQTTADNFYPGLFLLLLLLHEPEEASISAESK